MKLGKANSQGFLLILAREILAAMFVFDFSNAVASAEVINILLAHGSICVYIENESTFICKQEQLIRIFLPFQCPLTPFKIQLLWKKSELYVLYLITYTFFVNWIK